MAADAAKASGRAGDKSAQASLVDTHIGRIRKKVGEGRRPVRDDPRYRHGRGGNGRRSRHEGARRFQTCRLAQSQYRLRRAESDAREFSPTGGALGASFSERELGFLQSTIASLEQSQSEEQFLENLTLVQNAFNRVIHGTKPGGAPPARFTGGSPGLPGPTQAGVTGLRVPGIPQGNRNPAAVFDRMSIADLDRLNLANMNVEALDALEVRVQAEERRDASPATTWLRGFGKLASDRRI